MSKKTLKPLTIVPSSMYVERNADRQLKRILNDMGRPGYVLVARQMGKTNLLLNAKRENEGTNNIFAYLDVSNQFPDIRSFFRNIIDTIIETSQGRLDDVWQEISLARESLIKLPHKEHESELRNIIRAITGNLVICLDEIDALTKSSYSDQVFSFIRSIYFSGRSNFAEFNRVTYVLSGVAEPADIIKNKDISPFNIGEKIYLEDFSYDEAAQLLAKSCLPLDTIITDRIFEWANGHPRITWDIGSELEDMFLRGEFLFAESADLAAKRLYFSEIDSPPVDHIKRLAEENQEIRDALISIHYGRSDALAESVRTKLYLAGITRVASKQGEVLFKNRIMEESLSESFLLSLPSQSANASFEQGVFEYEEGDYSGAISHFKAALKNSLKKESLSGYIWLAKAYYRAEEFESVKEILNQALDLGVESPPEEALEIAYLFGSSYFQLGEYKNSVDRLSEIVDHVNNTKYYFEAVVDYLSASLVIGDRNDLEKQELLCKRLIGERAKILGERPIFRTQTELFAILHLLLAQIYLRKRLPERVATVATAGVEFASINTKILLLIALYDSATTSSKQTVLRQCIVHLKQCKGFAESDFGKNEIVEVKTLYDLLSRLSLAKRASEVDEVLHHLIFESKAGLSESRIMPMLSNIAFERGESQVGSSIFEAMLSIGEDNYTLLDLRLMLRAIMLHTSSKIPKYARKYLETFSEEHYAKIEDVACLNNIAIGNFHPNGIAIASKAIQLLKRLLELNEGLTEVEYLGIDLISQYLQVLLSFTSHPTSSELAAARALFTRVSSYGDFALHGFTSNHAKQMQSNLSSQLKRFGSLPNMKKGLKIGRNEFVTVKYGDARQFGKFKKYELDIQAGACELIGKGNLLDVSAST